MSVKINFGVELKDPYTLVFTDTTKLETPRSYEIDTMTLELVSSYLEDETYQADVLQYLNVYRQDREWYTLTSDALGLAESQPIPDGLYTATFWVNNQYSTTHTFVVYQDFKYKAEALLDSAGYSVDTDETNLLYQHSNKYDFETLSLLYSLLGALERSSLDGDSKAVEEALIKGTRILKTIETTGFDVI